MLEALTSVSMKANPRSHSAVWKLLRFLTDLVLILSTRGRLEDSFKMKLGDVPAMKAALYPPTLTSGVRILSLPSATSSDSSAGSSLNSGSRGWGTLSHLRFSMKGCTVSWMGKWYGW